MEQTLLPIIISALSAGIVAMVGTTISNKTHWSVISNEIINIKKDLADFSSLHKALHNMYIELSREQGVTRERVGGIDKNLSRLTKLYDECPACHNRRVGD